MTDWREELHPRTPAGKFTHVGGTRGRRGGAGLLARAGEVNVATRTPAGDAVHQPGGTPLVRTRAEAVKYGTPVGTPIDANPRPPRSSWGGHTWVQSNTGSTALASASADIMGLSGPRPAGEEHWPWSPGERRGFASVMLDANHHSPGSPEVFYHGTTSDRFAHAQVGDTIEIPLTAAAGSESLAEAFSTNYDRNNPKRTAMLTFPVGTPFMGITINSAHGDEEFEDDPDQELWGEAVVAGRFRVAERTDSKATYGTDRLTLVQTHTFDVASGGWVPVAPSRVAA